MAASAGGVAARSAADDDDDYMGDLSAFLPPDPPPPSSKKRPGAKPPPLPETKTKRPKAATWQEQRRLDRERKQREEDERTQSGLNVAISSSNIGFKMLRQMGYSPGTALGRGGRAEPVGVEIRRSRAGIGALSPLEEAERREREEEARARRREERWRVTEERMREEFGSRVKTQWRGRRVVGDFRKAEAALAQLENREVVEVEEEDGEEKEEEEEEEEVITEEDLHGILMKLRDEHHYCLYCGCQYESEEALLINCPGPSEDDH